MNQEVLRKARQYFNFQWPKELWTGIMFFMGERITKEEFEGKDE